VPETPDPPGSVSLELHKLQHRIQVSQAQAQLVTRYRQLVLDKARRRLRQQTAVDASDVAVSVWQTVLDGLPAGRFPCRDRQDFEELLGKITYHKAVNLYGWATSAKRHPAVKLTNAEILQRLPVDESHRQVAAKFYLEGQNVSEIADGLGISPHEVQARLEQVCRWLQKHRYRPIAHSPPEALDDVAARDQPLDALMIQELLVSLDDKLRETVQLKLQGLDNREIADRLNVTVRQVQRRLKLLKDRLEKS
jgi:DNA-directed RNA polymerase specialized sigma24 family protein